MAYNIFYYEGNLNHWLSQPRYLKLYQAIKFKRAEQKCIELEKRSNDMEVCFQIFLSYKL